MAAAGTLVWTVHADERTTMSGAMDKVKGRIKQKVGKATGNQSMRADGTADRAVGAMKEGGQKAKDWIDDKVGKDRSSSETPKS